ncbi:unnamed protein product [Paramecium pentaurelia]|uniref:Protein kinase domain-containing protein n=1 Tax=Paramecium pentaurelia TaxID=43138 RepID=A0A8S1W461_9CILI|nr:unnamed protein product [Paramecium pentaurelia]
MQYIQYHPQIIEEFKMNEAKSLFQSIDGSIITKFEDKESFKEVILLYNHKKKDLVQQQILFGLNSILNEDKYILLCKCYYEIRYTKLKQNEGFYIVILYNSLGKEYLIITNSNQFVKIETIIKRQCLSQHFLNKYHIIEQKRYLPFVQNYQNQELYCVLQIDKKQIITELDKEQFYNSIIIMNYFSEQTKIVKIYEENSLYYLFIKCMKLQSLESLILDDFEFREAPLVSIFYLTLQILQKYQNLGIYHGNINLKSIFINMQGTYLQILILFPKYLSNNNKGIQIDLLNLGQLLYQITFYEKKDKIKQFVDQKLITQQKQLYQNMNTENKQFKFLFRISQLDLLNQLLAQNITIENALKHQWFVTVKQNLKTEFMKEKKQCLNLRTIVESNNELSMTISMDKRIQSKEFAEYEIEDEFPVKCSILNPFQMNPSKQKHDNCVPKSKSFSSFDLTFENKEKFFTNNEKIFTNNQSFFIQ